MIRHALRAASLLLALLLAPPASAHPLAPALLELHEAGEGRYEVLWRGSVSAALGVEPQFPAACRRLREPEAEREGRRTLTLRWTLHCAGGLDGREISVAGLDRAGINAILRLRRADDRVQKALLDARKPGYIVPSTAEASAVFPAYLRLGGGHLLLGFDHLLFVLGLVLLIARRGALVLAVSAFTLGHSLTLALATLAVLGIPPVQAELGIALSILALAVELARRGTGGAGWMARYPWQMALAFGLLHGLGFAGALAEVGLPRADLAWALLAFNLGIEAGQLLVIALALALLQVARAAAGSVPSTLGTVARALPAYSIGTLAAFWCFERAVQLGL
ncbi:MAG: HupE/UreJ family protein [Gammaproteobacteria bacterium]|nr:HupE/UreJ family protein [Gammaproteobacteria bacterium]